MKEAASSMALFRQLRSAAGKMADMQESAISGPPRGENSAKPQMEVFWAIFNRAKDRHGDKGS
jgi:hypothetical protein